MLIGSKWKIESDSMNVVLSRKQKRKNKKTGESCFEWRVVGYFSSLQSALRELINQGVRDTKLKDLETVVAKINRLESMLDVLPKGPLEDARAKSRGIKRKNHSRESGGVD